MSLQKFSMNFWTSKNIWASGGNLSLILVFDIVRMCLKSWENTKRNHIYFLWKLIKFSLKGCQLYCPRFKFLRRCLKQIKHKLLIENYKKSLRGQYGSGCIVFWRLMKILWKDNMDQTVLSFMIFLLYPGLVNWVNSEI